MNVRTKLIGTIVLGAALLVPVAQAQSPDDRPGPRGPSALATHQAQTAIPLRPDDRPGPRGPGVFTTTVDVSTSGGFDWRDALIGGIGGMGTVLLLTGCLFLLLSQRNKTRTA